MLHRLENVMLHREKYADKPFVGIGIIDRHGACVAVAFDTLTAGKIATTLCMGEPCSFMPIHSDAWNYDVKMEVKLL